MRGVLTLLYFFLHQVVMLPHQLLAGHYRQRGDFKRADSLGATFGNVWATNMLRISGTRVTVEGQLDLPTDQAVLFVSNHQGAYDIPVLMRHLGRPVGFIAKESLANIRFFGHWMRLINCVFVKRGDQESARQASQDAIHLLQDRNQSLVVFPEGTRSESNDLAVFKRGSFRIACAADVPVIPVTLHGTYRIFEPRSKKIRPTQIQITIGDPIFPPHKDPAQLSTRVREEIQKNLSTNS